MRLLANMIIAYCLPRDRWSEMGHDEAMSLFKEARDMFNKTKRLSTSGELGELLVYLLSEAVLQAPQIVSKMSLKTSANMNVNGSDGIHLGINKGSLCFIFGESKVYQKYKAAIASALGSIKDFNFKQVSGARTQLDFEVSLIRAHLDVPPGPLRNEILELLDPYSPKADNYQHLHACFIGFDWPELSGMTEDTNSMWTTSFRSIAADVLRALDDHISSDPELQKLDIRFMFLPFEDVEQARSLFLKELMD